MTENAKLREALRRMLDTHSSDEKQQNTEGWLDARKEAVKLLSTPSTPEPRVTEAMVERAAREHHRIYHEERCPAPDPTSWHDLSPEWRKDLLKTARRILTAAISAPVEGEREGECEKMEEWIEHNDTGPDWKGPGDPRNTPTPTTESEGEQDA